MDLIEQIISQNVKSGRGKHPADLSLAYVRDLTAADMDMLANPPPLGSKTPAIAKIRHTHHLLAQLLANGKKAAEASMITGYSPSRISILKSDPAFAELVHYYTQQVEAQYLDVHSRLAALGMSTIEELQERLEQDPDLFTNRELRELGEMCLDRSVAPPKNGATYGTSTGHGSGPNIVVQFVSAEPQPTIIEQVPGKIPPHED